MVVVHAYVYLTLKANDVKWTVFLIFPFVCLQENIGAANQSIVGRIVIAKLSLVSTADFVGPYQLLLHY